MRVLSVAVVATLALSASAMPADLKESAVAAPYQSFFERHVELWDLFKAKYGRKYTDANEETLRFGLFKENMLKVDERNKRNGSPVHGVSKFADRSQEEFEVLLGRKNNGKPLTEEDAKKITKRNPHHSGERYNVKNLKYVTDTLPTYVNWVEAGATTPVKNQGQCGSCWAFSAAEEVESQWIMQGNSAWPFSPQQIASCVTDCYGCGGGDTVYAYEYLIGLGNVSPAGQGLGSDAFAPYIQSMYSSCSGKRCTESCTEIDVSALSSEYFYTGPFATITEYNAATDFCTGSCSNQNTTELAANMAVYGPVSICLDASEWSTYTGGVMSLAGCGGYAYKDVDHCVQLVGYNNQVSSPYWIVRNSWATNWGENGMIYLEYPSNTCGLANEATFVTIGNAQADFE